MKDYKTGICLDGPWAGREVNFKGELFQCAGEDIDEYTFKVITYKAHKIIKRDSWTRWEFYLLVSGDMPNFEEVDLWLNKVNWLRIAHPYWRA